MMKSAVLSRLGRRSVALASAGLFASMLAAQASAQANNGPVRLVRFSSVSGSVEWRPSPSTSWSDAVVNLPIREGAQVWAPAGARAELMFDDGTVLRLASNSTATLQSLYSDKNGEFTEIKLTDGLTYLRAPHAYSIYQIDTPDASIKADGPARFRVNVGSEVKLAMYTGQAAVENDSGTSTVSAGQYALVSSPSAACATHAMPPVDSWDTYNSQRDTVVFRSDPYVPHNVGLVSGELDSYGKWDSDPQYGHIWEPTVSAGWQPYYHGHWVFVDPYGWTWVGSEPWGWAPYHYGSWVHRGSRWGWYPGPATQYWSPAVVSFTYGNFGVSWAPLCPTEVQYPSAISLGFSGGDWSLYFSIGGACIYAPGGGRYCSPHPWMNAYLNQGGGWNNGGGFYHGYAASNSHFVPYNSRFGGAVQTSLAGFRSGGSFRSAGNNGYRNFQSGRSLSFNGRQPVSGPPNAAPDSRSFTATRSFASRAPAAAMINRHVVAASTAGFRRSGSAVASRPANAERAGGSFARPGATENRTAAARPTSAARWNPNARVNPAQAAAAARSTLHYRANPARVAAARRAPNSSERGARTMSFAGKTARATAPNRTAASRGARAARPANNARRSAPASRTPTRAAATRSATTRRSAPARRSASAVRRAPVRRSAPARNSTPRMATRRAMPQRQAPQPRQPQRQAQPQRQPQRQAPRGGGGRGGGGGGRPDRRRGG